MPLAVPDPDLEIRGGGGRGGQSSRPLNKGGDLSDKVVSRLSTRWTFL